ncbi:MAG: hypothetical protein HC828_20140, partial [Blastochloris sp.]|nr:hypothetical protein [Blastochloris sp.]
MCATPRLAPIPSATPLYTPPDALEDWIGAVREAATATGVQVANLYSGHGTYTTLGLAHPDPRVADHIQHNWLDVMIANAAALGAGLGFYCHAFDQATLRDPDRYATAVETLYRRLSELAQIAEQVKLPAISVEQMYAPHQIPWTILGARDLMVSVYQRGGAPMYITLDSGHMVGQANFARPTRSDLAEFPRAPDANRWLGYTDAQTPDEIAAYVGTHRHLFADPHDSDLYAWENLLCAYRKAAKGKRGHTNIAAFEHRLEENLLALQEELHSQRYTPGPYTS